MDNLNKNRLELQRQEHLIPLEQSNEILFKIK